MGGAKPPSERHPLDKEFSMKKKRCSILLAVAALVLLGLALPPSDGRAADVHLTYSIFFPSTHGQAKAADAWAKEVEKRTQGRVKISLFYGGTLTQADQCFDGVLKGISDLGMSCFAYTRGRFPLMEALDLPLGYPNGRAATYVANAFYRRWQPRELNGVKLLYIHAHGPGLLHSVKPIQRLEELKGKKIRSTGLSAKVVSALGAVPVAMPQGGTYEALQKGIVDGTFAPIETLKGWKQAEVVKSTTECDAIGYTTAMFVAMNLQKWQSLPPDVQKIIEQLNEEWIDVHASAWDDLDAQGRRYTLSLGNRIVPLSRAESRRWVKAIAPVVKEYIDANKVNGVDTNKAVRDLQASIQRFSKGKFTSYPQFERAVRGGR